MDQQSQKSMSAVDSGDSGARRACDQCRHRKIRCDKDSPCSNCRIAHRECSSAGVGQKPKEPRQRVLISTQYERKIDHIEDRLASIEQLLRTLANGSGTELRRTSGTEDPATSTPRTYSSIHNESPDQSGASTAVDGNDHEGSPFEGNSSLSAHTAFASEFLEQAVERTSLRNHSPSMQVALSSLRQLAGMQSHASTHEVGFPAQKPLPKGGFRELPLPPLQKVIDILREFRDSSLNGSSMIRCFMSVDSFNEYCRRVFFPTEDFSLATYVVVNSGLCWLFQEKSDMLESSGGHAEWMGYYGICRDNMETALGHLRLLVPARRETVEALLLGTIYAVETSRPSLAWQLNSTAAMYCQTLGWHRQPPPGARISSEQLDTQAALFWLTYIMDKGLALRLGRASAIQDYDITLPRTLGKTLDSSDAWKAVIGLWIRHSETQGKTYEQLYSPRALSMPEERRVECARAIAADLEQMLRESGMMREQASQASQAISALPSAEAERASRDAHDLDEMLQGDEVLYWSSLTLVYRAIPPAPGFPSTFSAECIEAARTAFRTHQQCIGLMESGSHTQATYLTWTILYCPFIPFIVIFCHVIESSDSDDLGRLSDFVNSLEPSCAMSGAIDRLHKLCQMLYNVAVLYLEGKAQQPQDADMVPVGNDFDTYLSALGLMPNSANEGVAAGGTFGGQLTAGTQSQAQTLQLGDWFSGNRYMMGLMEDDLPFTWA